MAERVLRGLRDLDPEQRACVLGAYAVLQGLAGRPEFSVVEPIVVSLREMIEQSVSPSEALALFIDLEYLLYISH